MDNHNDKHMDLLQECKLHLIWSHIILLMKCFFIDILICIIILCVCYLLIIIYTEPIKYSNSPTLNYPERKRILGHLCYSDRYLGEDLERYKLDDILLSERRPTKGKSIFFHETTCSKTGKLLLNARQTCAIESAASLNPNLDIFVLFASPTVLTEESLRVKMILNTYSNVYLRNVNLWKYTEGTPYSNWLKDGQLFHSKNLSNDISNFLRLLTLWHWGGTHLDLNIILKKTLENIEPNFIGVETKDSFSNAVINLDHQGFGHQIADLFLNNFTQSFNGKVFETDGPNLETQILKDICMIEPQKFMTTNDNNTIYGNRCNGFTVFNKETYNAIECSHWIEFFEEQSLQITLQLTERSNMGLK